MLGITDTDIHPRFKSLRFLLVDSKVPRDTKKLVAGVGEKKRQEPELMEGLMNAVQSISDEARRCLADPELSREQLLSAISVSHQSSKTPSEINQSCYRR